MVTCEFFRINDYVCMMAAPTGQKYFPTVSFALGARSLYLLRSSNDSTGIVSIPRTLSYLFVFDCYINVL